MEKVRNRRTVEQIDCFWSTDFKPSKVLSATDYEEEFADEHVPPSFDPMNNVGHDVTAKGFNPGLIVLLVVGGLVLAFLVGNYFLYMYAQKTLPPKKKKPVSKKKMKKERLRQGVSAPGE